MYTGFFILIRVHLAGQNRVIKLSFRALIQIKNPSYRYEIRRISQNPLIVRMTRSGWHLPHCGVAVASQVLCTSTTLNKSYDSVLLQPGRLHLKPAGFCDIHTIALFCLFVNKKTNPVGHFLKIVPRVPVPNNPTAGNLFSSGSVLQFQWIFSRHADGTS